MATNLLPTFANRNILVYYIATVFANTWFVAGNWLVYWLKYMTPAELGVFDAIGFSLALLVEIPSGAFADLFGKRVTLIFGGLVRLIGASFMAFSTDKYLLAVGSAFMLSGLAFASGTQEALAYDALKEKGQEQHYPRVTTVANSLVLLSTVCFSFLGGVLYAIDDNYPWYAWVGTMLVYTLISFAFSEPKIDSEVFNLQTYLKQFQVGFRVLFGSQLWRYFLLFLALWGMSVMYDDGFLRLAMAADFGFDGEQASYVFALVTLVSAAAVAWFGNTNRKYIQMNLLLITAVMGLAFLAAIFINSPWLGIGVMLAIGVVGNLSLPWVNILINQETESRYRATTLSTMQLFANLPYILVAITLGSALTSGQLDLFYLGLGLIILAIYFFSWFAVNLGRSKV